MFRILERTYKQSYDSAIKEFPHCKLLFKIDEPNMNEGYLLAMSTDIESHKKIHEYICNHREIKGISVQGLYKEEENDGFED